MCFDFSCFRSAVGRSPRLPRLLYTVYNYMSGPPVNRSVDLILYRRYVKIGWQIAFNNTLAVDNLTARVMNYRIHIDLDDQPRLGQTCCDCRKHRADAREDLAMRLYETR